MRRGPLLPTLATLAIAGTLGGCEPSTSPTQTGTTAGDTTSGGTNPAPEGGDAWGAMPETVEPFYFTEFEDWVGSPITSQPLARLIQRPIPEALDKGRAFVMFYRADCEHCHHMLEEWFTESVPAPTVAVAVPDVDPENAMPFPSTLVDRRTLPAGPQYVISTPALFALKDGVVTGFADDPEQPDAVEACLASNAD